MKAKIHTRQVPQMTPEMREYITRILDDEREAGYVEGKAEANEDREAGEWVMFGMGVLVGAPILVYLTLKMFS